MTEPADKEPVAQGLPTQESFKPATALSGIRRDLTDEELTSPGARKLLIDRLDQMEVRLIELRGFRDKFYEADKQVAVLKEKAMKDWAGEILYGVALSMGAVLVGLAPSAWDCKGYGWLSLLTGIVLILGGVASKVVRK